MATMLTVFVFLISMFSINLTNDTDILVPKPEILDQLNHIQDETIRNITAIQLFFCPFNKLCTVKQANFTVDSNHAEAARNCCSEIPCSCESSCKQTGTCCIDYEDGFMLDIEDANRNDEEDIYKCIFPMYRVLFPNIIQDSKWFIYKCPKLDTLQVATNKWYCGLDYSILWNFGHYKESAPVTDKKTHKSYKNMFCARCYGLKDDDVIFWTPTIQGNEPLLNLYFDFEELLDMIDRFPEFNIVYIPPQDIPPETYNCIIKDCDKSGFIEYDQFVEHACVSYRSVYVQQFQNIFCAICSGRNIAYDQCDKDTIVILNQRFSYIGILDFNSLDPPARQAVDQVIPKCPNGYYWDKILNDCRELACTFLSNLVYDRCELLYTTVKGYDLEVDLLFVTQEPTLPFTPANVRELYQNVTVSLKDIVKKSLANSSLGSFRILTRFTIIPYMELEMKESGVYHFKETKILGFGLYHSILSPKKSELRILKELIQDAQNLFNIKSFESYTLVDFMQFVNLLISTTNYNSSEIQDLMNDQMEKLEAELDAEFYDMSNEFSIENSTTQNTSFASGNMSGMYDDYQNGTPGFQFDLLPEDYQNGTPGIPFDLLPEDYQNGTPGIPFDLLPEDYQNGTPGIPFDLLPEDYQNGTPGIPFDLLPEDYHNGTPGYPFDLLPDFYPDDYWYNYTTPPTMEMNDTDVTNDSREAISVPLPEEGDQDPSSGIKSYFHINYFYYPSYEIQETSKGVLTVYSHLLCTLVKFNTEEVSMEGLVFTITSTNITLNINEVSLCDDLVSLCVCLEVYEDAVRKYLSTNADTNHGTSQQIRKTYSPEFITSVALSILSICCNIVTLLVYFLLKQLRTTPGLITMTLTFHLLIFQAIYILSNSFDITTIKSLCIGSGISIHFSFLLYIFWLNISSFHMYNTFTRMGIKFFNQSRFHPIKLLLKYSIYVYTMSTLFVALNIMVSMVTSNWNDLGYGSTTCYIKSPLMIGLSVGLPLGCVLVSNVFLFLRSTYVAVKGLDFSISRSGGINDRQYLGAFLKLSFLTGLTWIFGFIYQWANFKVIGYLFIILNAGQGVLIAIAFVCNSHVLKGLKAKF